MDRLKAGASLGVDQQLTSDNGRYALTMQGDGNLVLAQAGTPVWGTGTSGSGAVRAELQADGNLVLYTPAGQAVWSSGTDGNPNAALVLQGDRNLVISAADGRPLWSSRTGTGEPTAAQQAAAKPAGAKPAPARAKANATAAAAVPAAQAPTRKTVSAPANRTYTVVSGDTLWAIAERFYGNGQDYRKIAVANGIANPDAIDVGQKLVIPA